MSRPLLVVAVVFSLVAMVAPTRHQTFTDVSIDGRMLRMLVAGSGSATVVFENGLGGPLENWGKVQPLVRQFARTVSYDRLGVGLSDEGPRPRDARSIATELHRALRLANIAPPYVFVGASLGGSYVRVYAGLYPEDVAGLVLVDPTPDSEQRDGSGLPELDAWPATQEQARASRVPPNVPVFLIDAVSPVDVPFATDAIRALRSNQRADIAAESLAYKAWLDMIPGGHLIVTHESGHNVAQEQPQIVIETIRRLVGLVQRREAADPAREPDASTHATAVREESGIGNQGWPGLRSQDAGSAFSIRSEQRHSR